MKNDFYDEEPLGNDILNNIAENFKGESRGIHPWLNQTTGFTSQEKENIQKMYLNFDSSFRE